MDETILDAVLIPLANEFMVPPEKGYFVTLEARGNMTERQAFTQTMAELRAEGSVRSPFFGLYQLTPAGYLKYMERIHELKHPKDVKE
jgi:hypothetical protein